jgi:uncharacterized protein YcgI (DUF1989 family)
MKLTQIPARGGKADFLKANQRIKVINTHGSQVIDTWAFCAADPCEFMSMEHTRAALSKLLPTKGDSLYSNYRRPILTLAEDTSPGRHDTLMAACDVYRYKLLGCTDYHDNCTDNLAKALKEIGCGQHLTPCPLNLFMNIPWTQDGGLSFEPPVTKPGDFVILTAECEAILVFSACPQDMIPINGLDRTPTEAHFQIL